MLSNDEVVTIWDATKEDSLRKAQTENRALRAKVKSLQKEIQGNNTTISRLQAEMKDAEEKQEASGCDATKQWHILMRYMGDYFRNPDPYSTPFVESLEAALYDIWCEREGSE